MKKMSALAAVFALGMGMSVVAQAQPHRDDDRRGPPPHAQAKGHYKHDDRRNDRRDWDRDQTVGMTAVTTAISTAAPALTTAGSRATACPRSTVDRSMWCRIGAATT